MSEATKIEWADGTFNPWIGCTKVSPGCLHCYAENTTRARVLRKRGQETWGKGMARSRTSAGTWAKPVRWDLESSQQLIRAGMEADGRRWKRPRIFPSLCDWLDEEVPVEWLADFLKLIYETPNLDWLLLTKRPHLAVGQLTKAFNCLYSMGHIDCALMVDKWLGITGGEIVPPQNVWVGTSVEDQTRGDERIPELLKIPARVRFLSVEPLLENIRIFDALRCDVPIHWVIVGGESGKDARACNVAWVRGVMQQCQAAGVACFVKQLGSKPTVTKTHPGQTMPDDFRAFSHPKGGEMAEWPADLRVREFPVLPHGSPLEKSKGVI